MYTGRIIFSQLMDVIPKYQFRKIVAHHKGNYRTRSFTCWGQLLCLCFGQLTFRESLRDLTSTLNALGSQRYHMGIRTEIPLSTLADANASRPWQIYHQLAILLIDQARQLYHEDSDLEEVAESVYTLDSNDHRSLPVAVPLDRISKAQGCDQIIRLTGPKTKLLYPQELRRVHLIDNQHKQDIVQLSNITSCSTEQITDYYKQRWQIELFFKWIKQHLRIKAFYGQSVNAVKPKFGQRSALT